MWSILGIEPTTDLKVIKKAYAKQVKIYSPEDDPENFQSLREAYEDARRYAKQAQKSNQFDDELQDTPIHDEVISETHTPSLPTPAEVFQKSEKSRSLYDENINLDSLDKPDEKRPDYAKIYGISDEQKIPDPELVQQELDYAEIYDISDGPSGDGQRQISPSSDDLDNDQQTVYYQIRDDDDDIFVFEEQICALTSHSTIEEWQAMLDQHATLSLDQKFAYEKLIFGHISTPVSEIEGSDEENSENGDDENEKLLAEVLSPLILLKLNKHFDWKDNSLHLADAVEESTHYGRTIEALQIQEDITTETILETLWQYLTIPILGQDITKWASFITALEKIDKKLRIELSEPAFDLIVKSYEAAEEMPCAEGLNALDRLLGFTSQMGLRYNITKRLGEHKDAEDLEEFFEKLRKKFDDNPLTDVKYRLTFSDGLIIYGYRTILAALVLYALYAAPKLLTGLVSAWLAWRGLKRLRKKKKEPEPSAL